MTFEEWQNGRKVVPSLKDAGVDPYCDERPEFQSPDGPGVIYPDGAWIEGPRPDGTYYSMIYIDEIEGTLEECECKLWNDHSQFNQ
jgi:hypothetical protein